jgi:hypothetical protein
MTTLLRSKANAARIGRESRIERRQASNADVSSVSPVSIERLDRTARSNGRNDGLTWLPQRSFMASTREASCAPIAC